MRATLRILFILKRGITSGDYEYSGGMRSSGLLNSIQFIVDMLNGLGLKNLVARLAIVVDNNSIDHECSIFDPDIVVIEALWVVPEKIAILRNLYPHVRWIVRAHSAIPFLALEGNAIDWMVRSALAGAEIASNDLGMTDDINLILLHATVGTPALYLPNFYPSPPDNAGPKMPLARKRFPDSLDISCFGSIRPLKNHLIQALAAIRLASDMEVLLRFHINGTRVEQGGEPILKNLRALFANVLGASLVEHDWLDHAPFVELVRTMTAGLQVSFSETFCIVAADHAANGIPLVGSAQVPWISPKFAADPNDSRDIARKLIRAILSPRNENLDRLEHFSAQAVLQWTELVS